MLRQNEWQIKDPNGIIYPWFTHPFLEILERWDLKYINWLEFGAGYSTIWLRSRCKHVDSIEVSNEWANSVEDECQKNHFVNGNIYSGDNLNTPEKYLNLIPQNIRYNIISVDGEYRDECLIWALTHFGNNKGILIADK